MDKTRDLKEKRDMAGIETCREAMDNMLVSVEGSMVGNGSVERERSDGGDSRCIPVRCFRESNGLVGCGSKENVSGQV